MTCLLLLFAQPLVTLSAKERSLADVIADVSRQTSLRITAVPLHRPPLTLDLKDATPWLALDAIARRSGSRLELVKDAVHLAPRRPDDDLTPTHYDGPFRVRVGRVQTARDFLTGDRSTTLTLEVGWLPTLRPLFLDSAPHQLRAKSLMIQQEAANLVPVDGRPSALIDVTLPGVPRAADHVAGVSGKLNAVVLGDMLTFAYDAPLNVLQVAPPVGAQLTRVQNGVTARVSNVVLGRDRWTVRMTLDYPNGANRDFESFQAGSMVVANELRLVSLDGKKTIAPAASVADETGPRRTVVSFHFTDGPTGKRGSPADWTVRYRAPSTVRDVGLSFSFDKVPLP